MDVLDRWRVDFYDFTVPSPGLGEPTLARFGNLHERASRNGARHGTPVILSPSGLPDWRINLFFRQRPMVDSEPATWRRYAYSLVVWLDFLDAIDSHWDTAGTAEVSAFKDWRITDLRNAERVRATSFDTDRAGLNTFYTWAASVFGITNPVPSVSPGASDADEASWHGHTRGRRDPLRPAGARRRQVKWLLRPALLQWRDVGLRGYGFDGVRRPGWRGINEDRDMAFVDGLYGTGLRLREWASILDVELPTGPRRGINRSWLAAKCIKGGDTGREYWIPRRVAAAVAGYLDPLEGSRAEVISRAQRRGTYHSLHGVRVVTGHGPRQRTVDIEGPRGPVATPLDLLGPDERRLLFRRTSSGLEPLWVWLSVNGLPKKPHSWEDTFSDANERVKDAWIRHQDPDGLLDTVEEDRLRSQCPLWATPHMCRHSFALRWFSILSLVEASALDGFTDAEAVDLRERVGGLWTQMALLMGHSHPDTSRDYYLEPFTGLRLSYLMELLDEEEQSGVDSLVRAFATMGKHTLAPVATTLEGGDGK